MVELRAGQKGSGPPSFADIVGQDDLKEALLAVGVNDALDGLLVRGEKGTAKSTAVRCLADLLPDQRAVADCPYGCPPENPSSQCENCRKRSDPPVEERPVPLVTLPLGATRERVVGTLSVADAMDGAAEFDPGLLARANRGILYVDEVNLLDDHLVDVLLDAAASGRNRVERDGMSVAHPAEFTLVGTMNPEEGDLRPQLRDRFAIQATVTACDDVDDRVAIIRQAIDGERREAAPESTEPARRLRDARERLHGDVVLPREFAETAAEISRDAGVDGHRGDIAIARTARTLAALDGRDRVLESDVERAAEFALPHRLQSRPFEEGADLDDVLDDHFESDDGEGEPEHDGDEGDGGGEPNSDAGDGNSDEGEADADETGGSEPESGTDDVGSDGGGSGEKRDGESPGEDSDSDGDAGRDSPSPSAAPDSGPDDADSSSTACGGGRDDGVADDGASPEDDPVDSTPLVPGQNRAGVGEASSPDLSLDVDADAVAASGSRASGQSSTGANGARVRTTPAGDGDAIDAAASVRAAAQRGNDSVGQRDLRASVRESDASALVVFAVDASASMRPAMRTAKGVVLELLEDAYQHRDEVAFVAFSGDDAEVLLPPTDSVTLAARHLKDLPTADRTPLPAGLRTATDVIDRADPDVGVAVVVTDGRANVGERPTAATRAAAEGLRQVSDEVLVVDAGEDGRASLADVILDATGGSVVPLSELRASGVDSVASVAHSDD
ncbi:protoporphyrin IX magnesium-chelatase [Halomicrobium zhouii]|uniref:Protoporphyrin IX magnesium-chelatase n=1 Tax=Halomicrobium zhouii TaxID=767519 RepID=A0A1I6LZ47_9EURY|nr:VWA domain-containing protein [Halomicrobium zhouii]SFS08685.1 protoporphyrin IX magnesium-chelatase [Halomicrobium zhouii]